MTIVQLMKSTKNFSLKEITQQELALLFQLYPSVPKSKLRL